MHLTRVAHRVTAEQLRLDETAGCAADGMAETNNRRLFDAPNVTPFVKDGINNPRRRENAGAAGITNGVT